MANNSKTGRLDFYRTRHTKETPLTMGERPLGEIMWLYHFDLIHHRGQLSTYLRPMGAKVPSIYGKSGDEKRG